MSDTDPAKADRGSKQTPPSKAALRQQRLAAQLRENLKKRKNLSRAKARTDTDQTAPGSGDSTNSSDDDMI
jgi:hypothetical protein